MSNKRRLIHRPADFYEEDVSTVLRGVADILDHQLFQISSDQGKLTEAAIQASRVRELFQVGIVTALPVEYAAVKKMIDGGEVVSYAEDPLIYYEGEIVPRNRARGLKVVALLLPRTGNNMAAIATTHLLRTYPEVKDVVVVGVCGAIPSPSSAADHVRLGDVIVSTETGVWQFDHIKKHADRIENRGVPSPPSPRMIQCVNGVKTELREGRSSWEGHIARCDSLIGVARPSDEEDLLHDDNGNIIPHPHDSGRIQDRPRVHYGLVGSSNTLLRDLRIRNQLAEQGVRAVEMELSGVADSAWVGSVGYLMIKGAVDYCDEFKNDRWKAYSATVAAAFSREILEKLAVRSMVGKELR